MFFELYGHENKINFEKCLPQVKRALFPFSLIPVLKKIQKKVNEPQVLFYDKYFKPMLQENDPLLDTKITLNRLTATLVWSANCTCKFRVPALMKFSDILRHSMWNGWFGARVGYISTVNRIWTVTTPEKKFFELAPTEAEDDEVSKVPTEECKTKKAFMHDVLRDENGNIIYIYLPLESKALHSKSTHYVSETIPLKDAIELLPELRDLRK
jgi:hypothetical protein